MASSSDSEDDSFMAVDQEETVLEGTMEQDEEPRPVLEAEETRHNRSMSELPEEVLEYILSFLSPYQEHKTAALVCKQWYRLIKGVAHQCYHGFIKAVQEGNIQWESRTYPYPGTPITQRFSHTAPHALQDLSSPTRGSTQALAVRAPSSNHRATREFPIPFYSISDLYPSIKVRLRCDLS